MAAAKGSTHTTLVHNCVGATNSKRRRHGYNFFVCIFSYATSKICYSFNHERYESHAIKITYELQLKSLALKRKKCLKSKKKNIFCSILHYCSMLYT